MYCKYCGKAIDNDSAYCRFCGQSQHETDIYAKTKTIEPNHTELGGEIYIRLGLGRVKFQKVQKFISKHSVFFVIFGIWFLINSVFLANGENRDGFWPHTYTHRERVAEHTRLEYIPWSGEYTDVKYWDLGPEMTKFSWDLEYYGFSEFIIYAILIPFIIFLMYNCILRLLKSKKESNNGSGLD